MATYPNAVAQAAGRLYLYFEEERSL